MKPAYGLGRDEDGTKLAAVGMLSRTAWRLACGRWHATTTMTMVIMMGDALGKRKEPLALLQPRLRSRRGADKRGLRLGKRQHASYSLASSDRQTRFAAIR